ncbi:trypsin-like serine protease [Scytonema sp. UIC 10036]|uniref:S1 family peptidase n=1 Tax=Scytonema sp. UIC 10036 TaxID=2304196 RepID=UPI0012DA6CA3|nr:serine protease [Scytonema sp. UIC 10036]MUG95052.1 trypsin-like serine protease [Scytonema sp. UIC 10036]
MRFNSSLPATLIGISMVIVQTQVAAAPSPIEIDEIAQAITVLIDAGDLGSGSGVIIKKQGDVYSVVTTAHVLERSKLKYEIVAPDNQKYVLDYRTVKKLPAVDLAILQFTSPKNYRVAKFGDSDSIQRNAKVYVAGFPGRSATIQRPIYNFMAGKVIANALRSQPVSDSGYNLVYDNSTLPGMSGGPVLNDRGEVIGIHGRGEIFNYETPKINPQVAFVYTGRSLGIPIKTFLQLTGRGETSAILPLPETPIAVFP